MYAPPFLFASAVSIIAALSISEFQQDGFQKKEAAVDAVSIILAAGVPFIFLYSGGVVVPWLVFFGIFVFRLEARCFD